jgi:purine-nucleoside/S-methyl-5'-thioadenosine phosphorylase / adenosine deaminase
MAYGSLLQPGLAWREAAAGVGVPLLVAEDLEAAGISAAFSCRVGGRSRPPFDSLNIGLNTGDDAGDVHANRALLAGALGLDAAELATVYQVHGPAVLVVEPGRRAPGVDGRPVAAADGIVTGAPGVAAVGAADCVPVLLADPDARVVGAVHAGWRGIALGVVETAVAALALAGGNPGVTVAVIGPAIGGCCYDVGPDVRDAVLARCASAASVTRDGRPSLDLAAGAAELLHAAGVREVRAAGLCTGDDPGRFFSARRDRRTGRQAGVIVAW